MMKTSRQARRERREAERKAKKLEMKQNRATLGAPQQAGPQAEAVFDPETLFPLFDEFEDEEDDLSPEIIAEAMSVRAQIHREAGLDGFVSQKDPHAPLNTHTRHAAESAKGTPDTPTVLCTSANNPEPDFGFVSHRAQINRQNAQHSTGPRTEAGRLTSSRNSLKHGLASGELIIPGENPFAFESLRNDLIKEHQPANTTEELLVNEMAQAYWLTQRAIGMQNDCFSEDGVDEKRLALFLRYQTTHERRFHKALNTLLKLKKDRARELSRDRQRANAGFVSQRSTESRPRNAEIGHQNGFVSQTHSNVAATESGKPALPLETDADVAGPAPIQQPQAA